MIPGLPDDKRRKIAGVLAEFPQVEAAILYGSRAKGTHRRGSDIDLTLVGEGLDTSLLNAIAVRLDDLLLPEFIDLSSYAHLDNPGLRAHIGRVGREVYRREAPSPSAPS